MPLERIDSYFNGAVESYDERLKRSAEDEDGYIRRTAEFFPKKEHLHILDIGIGTGILVGGSLAEVFGMHRQMFFVCAIALLIGDILFFTWTSRHYTKNKLEG